MNSMFLTRLVPRKPNFYSAITIALILFAVGNVATIAAMTIPGINPGSAWLTLPNNSGASFFLHNAGSGNALEFVAQDGGTNHWQVMNITKQGNVTMGHSNDPATLDITGGENYNLPGDYNANLQAPLILRNAAGRSMVIGRKSGTGNDPWIFATGDYYSFSVDATKSFTINKTGVQAEKITVSTSWADYVFEDDYKLMPLDELEKFIAKNKHLPNIPSANTVEGQGLDLGEMQKLQMEKIEELTLHLIEKDKQISNLEARLESLERSLK